MAMVKIDSEALGHYVLTMTLFVNHNSHELTTTLMIWQQALLDLDTILEDCYHFIVVMLFIMIMVNVPQLEFSNLHKFV